MSDIQKVIDGDTVDIDGQTHRVAGINTPESVHPEESRNTPEGKAAAEFARTVLPEGAEVATESSGKDVFGRSVSSVARQVNGTEIDYGLVALDQEFSKYYINHGRHADPKKHAQYREYFSTYAPYNFGDVQPQLSAEEMALMQHKHVTFDNVTAAFKQGDATQEDVDWAMAQLYSDPQKVVSYRHQLMNWQQPVDQMVNDGSDRFVHAQAMQDPELRELYNRAVRNSHLYVSRAPEQEASFWDKAGASLRMLTVTSNATDTLQLWQRRYDGSRSFDLPDDQLVKGIPEQFQPMIMAEAEKYGDHAAVGLRDQLAQDIADKSIFDNMEWYAQIGYGLGGMVADPTTLITGGLTSGTAVAATNATRLWQMSPMVSRAHSLASWATIGATEGAVLNMPRLSGDHTYTAKDYTLDIMFDAAFGVGIGGVVEGVKYGMDVKAARRKEQVALQKHVEVAPPKETDPRFDGSFDDVLGNDLGDDLTHVSADGLRKTASAKSADFIRQVADVEVKPWEEVTAVGKSGFTAASNVLTRTFDRNSAMYNLTRKQVELNNKNLDVNTQSAVRELNSTILHIASAFPDGKMPKDVEKAINSTMWKQTETTSYKGFDRVLQGTTSQPTKELGQYVENIKKLDVWQNVQPLSRFQSTAEFYREHSGLLNRTPVDDMDILQLSKSMPQELSFIKDMVELNTLSQTTYKNNPEFKSLVEELNALVSARLAHKEAGGVDFTTAKSRFAAQVKMTPEEVFAQVKREGLKLGSPEAKARIRELRNTPIKVSEDVQAVGKVREFNRNEEVISGRVDRDTAESPAGFGSSSVDAADTIESVTTKVVAADKTSGKQRQLRKVERTSNETARDLEDVTLETFQDDLIRDILPRSFSERVSHTAYKKPTLDAVNALNKQLKERVLDKLGAQSKNRTRIANDHAKRMVALKSNWVKRPDAVINRLRQKGNIHDLVDVIRVANTKLPVSDAQVKVDIKEADLDHILKVEPETLKSAEEVAALNETVNSAVKSKAEESISRISNGLLKWDLSGERDLYKLAQTPMKTTDYIAKIATKLTKDISTKMQESGLASAEFVGARITEKGAGYKGMLKRPKTGGIIRAHEYNKLMGKWAPQYSAALDQYAKEKGRTVVGRMNAQQMAGAQNADVAQFNKDFWTVMERRRQGREIPEGIPKAVSKYADEWQRFTDTAFDDLLDARITGFTKDRKVKHYIPRVWKAGALRKAIEVHGKGRVLDLFTKAYESAQVHGTNKVGLPPEKLAKEHLEWLENKANSDADPFMPAIESRAKHRQDLDVTVETDGLSMLDLLNDEIAELGTKYSNRVAGLVGLSKSTDGMLRSQLDIDALKAMIHQEGLDKNIPTESIEKWYTDIMDMMMGRPTRGGLPPEFRDLKDLTTLTRMGGLGTAQLIETGQVITRATLNLYSDPRVMKKVFEAGGDAADSKPLLQEIQSMSNITDDIEWFDRQSVHLDQAELKKIGKLRELTLWIADKSTFGKLKAPASRLLGKTTGFNAVRRAQARATQMSFAIDVANHFKHGKGKMGNARMADVGLTDPNGENEAMRKVFNEIVEYDENGLVKKLNGDKWPKDVYEEFSYAMLRDEGQNIQRTHVGELPPWMNRPMMGLIFQFRNMPLVATNKQLGRNIAFADKEAVASVMINTAIAGMVRYSKFALLGTGYAVIRDQEWKEPNDRQMQVHKYIASAGIFPDFADLVMNTSDINSKSALRGSWDIIAGQVPVLGLAEDYAKGIAGAATGDAAQMVDASHGLLPLGNTAYGDMIFAWMSQQFGNTETRKDVQRRQ